MSKIGLYLHVPFCEKKCPYCDFYSIHASEEWLNLYTDCMIKRMQYNSFKLGRLADTLYFGGGTPSLLGRTRIARLIKQAKISFGLQDAEITAEVNPGIDLDDFLQGFRAEGGNRLSIGMQSADDRELKLLGRRHTFAQVVQAVETARRVGIDNLSLDLMLGIPGQTVESAKRSAAVCAELGVPHVSAYLLKIEPNTAFYQRREQLQLPDEEEACTLYEAVCDELERHGLRQYEISNFAKPGFESRHNLKYWHCEEYLGLGPAAHSFLSGRRFYETRDLRAFLAGQPPIEDVDAEIPAGSPEEYAMLALRLTEGLQDQKYRARFGFSLPTHWKRSAQNYAHAGLTECWPGGFRFTRKGFLVSNALLAKILYES